MGKVATKLSVPNTEGKQRNPSTHKETKRKTPFKSRKRKVSFEPKQKAKVSRLTIKKAKAVKKLSAPKPSSLARKASSRTKATTSKPKKARPAKYHQNHDKNKNTKKDGPEDSQVTEEDSTYSIN